jgi:hypothetical protein
MKYILFALLFHSLGAHAVLNLLRRDVKETAPVSQQSGQKSFESVSEQSIKANASLIKYALACSCVDKSDLYSWDCGEYCSGVTKDTQVFKVIRRSNGVDAYVAVNERSQKILIVFRSTNQLKDWWNTNLRASKVRLNSFFDNHKDIDDSILVHKGFMEAYMSVRDEVLYSFQRLRQRYPTFNYLFTGYSMGAGMSFSLLYVLFKNI